MRDYTPEQPFDVVFAMASLYYISPMETLSHKIREWVKPGGIFVVGTDLYLDSPESTKWPHILNVEMDIRSEESWVQLFVVAYGLENVQKLRIILPHRTDEGTLFIWGSRPR
eukprot:TRINITY_DN594_c0_g1_i2.p1 TRINITY_DN594_c0_g1~~TRINITY_DN594_c0_g1_i2.p1  ORF type:complete len:112 (-),score=17.06 TRINITY_DN594_c0_g1_i2:143-478(-)